MEQLSQSARATPTDGGKYADVRGGTERLVRLRFEHESFAQRVVFAAGEGEEAVAAEVKRLEPEAASRVMVVAGPAQKDVAARLTAGLRVAVTFDEVVQHVPVGVAERARAAAAAHEVDVVVSIGGGSTTGLAKAVALTTGLPVVAVPTTYAGSEATNVWGLTEGRRKTTGVDPRVLPRSVVYDATLTTSLPVDLAVASGLNAVAHCVDSMWAPRANPINRVLAAEGLRALDAGLPSLVGDPQGIEAHEHTLYGAYLAAVAFASAGSGLHHKICHLLGGMFDLPHAQTHAVVLPHVLALNAPNAPDAAQRIAAALGSVTATQGLRRLRRDLDAPVALRDYGMPEAGIPAAVEAALEVAPADNPTPVTSENLTRLLRAAWEGSEPS